ncbi:MAG: MMPL family transporter [Pseudomonadales bacterium]|nr:MMPL family transporter [Pseudomonadales bacterium]
MKMLILSERACRKPKVFLSLAGLISLVIVIMVALPSLWPGSFSLLHSIRIDTDPENMLNAEEPVRVTHNSLRHEYNLHDMLVVGVVNKSHPQGVFNQATLARVYQLTTYAQSLTWQENGEQKGVISVDLIAPSSVDNIEQAGLGSIRFEWLMARPPQSEAESLSIADKAYKIPFLKDTLVSSDRKALALYIPISEKKVSYRVATLLREKIDSFEGDDEFYITGLPVAQDQFGVEMFQQMAISAPAAMALIFLLMWLFFRNLKLIISPMIVALVSVIMTMGLLIITGHTVHIMSSMIPIFIMPIAVLDAVHILSDFFDRYPQSKNRYQALREVMEELSSPMLYTSLTTSIGFSSLALTPIPPVQVFGLFVGVGVLIAWVLTITLVPAYIMLMPESSLKGFGMVQHEGQDVHPSLLARLLFALGKGTYQHAKLILVAVLALVGVAYYGIQKIQINDNPVKWFAPSHEIRIADNALNERFAGTYMAYLSLRAIDEKITKQQAINKLLEGLASLDQRVAVEITNKVSALSTQSWGYGEILLQLQRFASEQADQAVADADWEAWDQAVSYLQAQQQDKEVFKNPELLSYISQLQQYLLSTGLVGKSNSLTDIVKTVHRELLLGESSAFRVPDTSAAVAQTLMTYQGSHRPQDLWHFVTPDYRKTNLWIQLKSGDNQDMRRLVTAVDQYLVENPPPLALAHDWFGLTYINMVWQDKMVTGMMKAFLGSFVIVLAMMAFLFRSFWWGLLSMVPLTVTIALTYGLIGIIGKDYDMPVAVLSSLSLGLAVDYAIHFLARARELRKRYASWEETVLVVYGEPARAITRNIIVIGCGFLPLLAAPLVPYQTVGFFISTILLLAGAATLLLLPALIRLFEHVLFKNITKAERGI